MYLRYAQYFARLIVSLRRRAALRPTGYGSSLARTPFCNHGSIWPAGQPLVRVALSLIAQASRPQREGVNYL